MTSYLHSRGIGLDTARRFCKEVYYRIDDKKYFGIGNEHSNGWNIRNKYWKGCSGQGYSHYSNNGSKLCLFEGIFDLLSYVELQKEKNAKEDYLVLNSLANLKKALPLIEKYNRVDLYMNRDGAGMKTSNELIKRYTQCSDLSKIIYPHKDFNEYLVGNRSRGNLR